MQRLNQLWQLVNAAGAVRDLAQQTRTYYFAVTHPVTFYLRIEDAEVIVVRWSRPMIELTTRMQGAFGWRLLTDQDENGVYVAAKRRHVVGGFASARLQVYLPLDTYGIFRLSRCDLRMVSVDGTIDYPPQVDDTVLQLESGE